MPQPGQEIDNPVTGERAVFRTTGDETDGAVLRFDLYVEPQGFVAAEHVHPSQTEHFEIWRGRLRLRRDGVEEVYRAGGEATIPPGTPHVWWNDGEEELHATVELRPASRFDEFLASLFALARAGRTDERGMPGLLQIAVMMQKYDDVIYPASPPRGVQKALFGLLAPIGRLLGYRADPREEVPPSPPLETP